MIGDKLYKTINLYVVVYGCESRFKTWRHLRFGNKVRVFWDVTRGLEFARLICGTGVGRGLPTFR